MDPLRIRLRIQNCPPCSGLNSWYLLNQGKFKDVGAFLADVKDKFCIRVDKLRCHIRGFVLPLWESIGIIRDEDEIIVEEDGGNICFSSTSPLQHGIFDVKIGSNKTVDDGESAVKLSSFTKIDELLPSVWKKSSFVERINEKVRHKKKRKRDMGDEGNVHEEVDKESFRNGTKEMKKNREVSESQNAAAEIKQTRKKKRKDKVVSDDQSSSIYFGLGEKDPCQDIKELSVVQAKETVEKKTRRKDRKEISIMSDKLVTTSELKGFNNKPAGSRNKKRNRNANTSIQNKDTNDTIANGEKGLENNLSKPAPQINNEVSKKKHGERNASESSFQILSRSVECNGRHSSQLSIKSNYSGNHVYFDSDGEDISIKDDSVPIATFGDSKPIITGKTNTSFGPVQGHFHEDAINNPSLEQGKTSYKNFIDGINSTTNSTGDNGLSAMLDEQSSPSFLEQSEKTDIDMEKSHVQERNYDILTPLQGAPRVGDKIAFKVLEMSLSYTPEISDYKEAVVKEVDNKGTVIVLLADQSKRRKTGDGTLTRKFELDSDSDHEHDDMLEIHWKEFIGPKLLSV